jgi:hypothetical protein
MHLLPVSPRRREARRREGWKGRNPRLCSVRPPRARGPSQRPRGKAWEARAKRSRCGVCRRVSAVPRCAVLCGADGAGGKGREQRQRTRPRKEREGGGRTPTLHTHTHAPPESDERWPPAFPFVCMLVGGGGGALGWLALFGALLCFCFALLCFALLCFALRRLRQPTQRDRTVRRAGKATKARKRRTRHHRTHRGGGRRRGRVSKHFVP